MTQSLRLLQFMDRLELPNLMRPRIVSRQSGLFEPLFEHVHVRYAQAAGVGQSSVDHQGRLPTGFGALRPASVAKDSASGDVEFLAALWTVWGDDTKVSELSGSRGPNLDKF